MEIVKIKALEDCVGGGMTYEYLLTAGVPERLMRAMAADGRLDYHPEFLMPFYKIVTPDGLQIKGILGDTSLEVVYPQADRELKKLDFEVRLRTALDGLAGPGGGE
ncbi:MAG TPA: hypothetical protein VLN41_00220 [Candidatus Bathyarchaeia archaeon]|nr:hypothetical protein [Candidatus Bathyarchaeia archaeon]